LLFKTCIIKALKWILYWIYCVHKKIIKFMPFFQLEYHYLLTSNWNKSFGCTINFVNLSKFRSISFFIPKNRSEIRCRRKFREAIVCGKGIVSPKLRIHRARRGHVRARGPCGRCKLGGNISAVKYLSRLTRRRGGSYHSIGVRAWHEIYYARYIAISSTSAVEYVTLYTTVTVMQVEPCFLIHVFSFT